MAPLGPYKLVTVNNAPERAKRLIGRVVEDVKDKYTIIHAGNADGMFFFFISALKTPADSLQTSTRSKKW